jgi:hypothetical protein
MSINIPFQKFTPLSDCNGVHFHWDVSDAGYVVSYWGAPERLIECGAIEPEMAIATKQKVRRDSHGHYFRRVIKTHVASMTRPLMVTRLILDEALAATLPGVTPVRFKLLDILDAQAGRAYIHRFEHENQYGTKFLTVSTAGSREALSAVYSEAIFNKRLRAEPHYGHWYLGFTPPAERKDPDFNTTHFLIRLMRGYWMVERTTKLEQPKQEERPTSASPTKSLRAALRVVVDNTRLGASHAET